VDKVVGPTEKIIIAYAAIPQTALFQVASVRGFFSTEGLEVIPQPHPFGKVALNALLEGKADMATSADTPVMFAVTGGQKIYAVAEISTSTKAEAIIARKDRGIAAPMDIRGKNIGVTLGTAGDFFMDSFLATRGIRRDEVRIVDMKPDEMLDALIKGRVDAVLTWVPNIQNVQNGLGDRGIIFYDEAIFHELFCLSASQEFAKQNPGTIKKVLRALIRAETFIKENPEESRRLVAEFIKMDRPLLDSIWGSFNFRVTLDQSLLISLEDQANWALKNKLTVAQDIPNFLEIMYINGLQSVQPDAVRIMQ
jgi:NitT/TauT family transport system substrate-binding protein